MRRLAQHYPDATIAGILNTQGRLTARGLRFNQNLVGNLRRHWKIASFEQPALRPDDALRSRVVDHGRQGYVVMQDATRLLGVTRQTVLQRVKRGDRDAVLVCNGRRKGLDIKVVDDQPDLFEHVS